MQLRVRKRSYKAEPVHQSLHRTKARAHVSPDPIWRREGPIRSARDQGPHDRLCRSNDTIVMAKHYMMAALQSAHDVEAPPQGRSQARP